MDSGHREGTTKIFFFSSNAGFSHQGSVIYIPTSTNHITLLTCATLKVKQKKKTRKEKTGSKEAPFQGEERKIKIEIKKKSKGGK